jgi:hypothetical protein
MLRLCDLPPCIPTPRTSVAVMPRMPLLLRSSTTKGRRHGRKMASTRKKLTLGNAVRSHLMLSSSLYVARFSALVSLPATHETIQSAASYQRVRACAHLCKRASAVWRAHCSDGGACNMDCHSRREWIARSSERVVRSAPVTGARNQSLLVCGCFSPRTASTL